MKHELCIGLFSCKKPRTLNLSHPNHYWVTIVSGHWTEANPARVTFWSGCSQEAAGYPQRQQLSLLGQLRQPILGHNQAVHFHRGRFGSKWIPDLMNWWWTDDHINLNLHPDVIRWLQWNLPAGLGSCSATSRGLRQSAHGEYKISARRFYICYMLPWHIQYGSAT